ncbi:hypothetical protein B9Z19DRAFT_1075948 [Tuber borchii]|uniref:SAP domain-containing protein n=1 Tax=Tuber borchii TaxID=42251 RepID=A0A2T7A2N0_TUBBO|nr:hypothetical protein B9Z19DRAFT_1075948 [Tuber borchii]
MPSRKHTSHDGVNLDRLKVPELKKLCSERGIPDNGLKCDLVQRLTALRKGKQTADGNPHSGVPPTSQSFDAGGPGCQCQAIVVAEAEMGDDKHIIRSAKRNLSAILDNDELSVDRSTPTLTVGNSHGHAWAMLHQQVESYRSETSSLREEVGMLKITVASLEGQVTSLTLSVKAYGLIRHRFLVNYKQKQMGIVDDADKKYVLDGNSIAHGGDVKADAELYKDVTLHRRQDFPVFESLYGCIPQVIWPISHPETLNIINFHATVISNSSHKPSTQFADLFKDFMKKWKDSYYVTTYLDDGQETPVTKAYWTFYRSLGSEKGIKKPALQMLRRL